MVIVGMYLLSWIFGLTGLWLTLAFAEAVTLLISFAMYKKYQNIVIIDFIAVEEGLGNVSIRAYTCRPIYYIISAGTDWK